MVYIKIVFACIYGCLCVNMFSGVCSITYAKISWFKVLLASEAMDSNSLSKVLLPSEGPSVAVEFRHVSGEVIASTTVSLDATVATFNEILWGMGIITRAETRYVNGNTSIDVEDLATPVCGGTWTVVLGSGTSVFTVCDCVSAHGSTSSDSD